MFNVHGSDMKWIFRCKTKQQAEIYQFANYVSYTGICTDFTHKMRVQGYEYNKSEFQQHAIPALKLFQ